MPLVRVSLRKGKPAAYRKPILDGIYAAMRSAFEVPEEDRFMVINEHDEAGDRKREPLLTAAEPEQHEAHPAHHERRQQVRGVQAHGRKLRANMLAV